VKGRVVLVVEDHFLIADDIAALLRESGAEVIGPANSLPMAMRLAGDAPRIDAALLNINLQEVAVFPLADELLSRGVPILFVTGYGEEVIPDEYSHIKRCDKPIAACRLVDELRALVPPIAA
jgi:DNA-binding response OmpR family regulator